MHCNYRRSVEQQIQLIRKLFRLFLYYAPQLENIPSFQHLKKINFGGNWRENTKLRVLEIKNRGVPIVLGERFQINPFEFGFHEKGFLCVLHFSLNLINKFFMFFRYLI